MDTGKGSHDPEAPGVGEMLLANYKVHDRSGNRTRRPVIQDPLLSVRETADFIFYQSLRLSASAGMPDWIYERNSKKLCRLPGQEME